MFNRITNPLSVDILNNSRKFDDVLQKNIERLSTGKKINKASDNAAGLAISERLESQIRGKETAIKNVKQGQDLIMTAEQSLESIQEQIQRIRGLTIQSRNGTYTTEQKDVIEKEINQIIKNIDNTSNTTSYNGILLKGKERGIYFDGIDDVIRPNTSTPTQIASVSSNFTYEFWAKPFEEQEMDPQTTSGAGGTKNQNYAIGATHGPTGTNNVGVGIAVGTNGIAVYEHNSNYMPAILVYETPITDLTHIAVVYENNRPSLYINGEFVKQGEQSTKTVFASEETIGGYVYGNFNGIMDDIRLWSVTKTASEIKDGMDKTLNGAESGLFSNWKLDETSGTTISNVMPGKVGAVYNGPLFLNHLTTGDGKVNIHNDETDAASLEFELPDSSLTQLGLIDFDIHKDNALQKIDSAINILNTERGKLGALHNRMEYSVSNLETSVVNHSAAKIRIKIQMLLKQ